MTLRPVLYLEIRPKKGAEKGRINARLISLITDFRLIFGQFLCDREDHRTSLEIHSNLNVVVTSTFHTLITPE